MNEIIYSNSVYEYRASSNNGSVKIYISIDNAKALITDSNNKILFDISVSAGNQLCIYQMSV